MTTLHTYGLIVFILICTLHINAQNPDNIKFDRLSSENVKLVKGLSQNWVYSIIQDRYGYIWFGTWDGLNKYDGYNFTTYNVSDGLSDHTIYSFIEGTDGNLWIGTDKGLNKFDRATKSFRSFHNFSLDSNLYSNRVLSIVQTNDTTIWLGTGGGLIKFNPVTLSFENFLSTSQDYDSPRSNYILHICEDTKGILWIATTYGLVIFDPETRRSTRYYTVEGDSTSFSNNNIRHIIQESSGNFWVSTRNGLNYYDTATRKVRQYYYDPDDPTSIGSNWVRVAYEDRSGNLWFGTESGGLNRYNREEDNFIRYNYQLNDDNSLSNDRVYSIMEDVSGNLWIGTSKGVNKINKIVNEFSHIQQIQRPDNSLNNNFIWSFAEDATGNLFIATSQGVNIFDKHSGKYEYLVHQPDNLESIAGNEIRTLIYSERNYCLWLGIYGTGIDRYDIKSKTFTHFVPEINKNSLSNDYINDIIEDCDGMIWIATARGLNMLDPGTNQFTIFKNNPADTSSLSNNITVSLYEAGNGDIWIGTDNGLNRYNKSNKQFTRYLFRPKLSNTHYTIFYIMEDRAGKIWVGTSGNGLIKLYPESGEFKVFTTKDGLPNNIVYGILEDNDGNLWMGTNMGLVKFFVIGERFINYDVKDGIQSFEFNLGSCYLDAEGNMYFGGMNGYNVFNPGDIKINPNPPVVVISAFRKFNEIQPIEILNGDSIKLKHDDNFFSFEISALNYTNPSKNRYMYYLENVDKDWVKTDANNRIAEYKKVRPGIYTFYANGSNDDGIWNKNGIAVTVIISPAWHETWIFRILLAIAIISGLWVFIYRRIKRIKNKNEVERKLLEIERQKFELEQKALRLQMNPHFIFNSLNSIQSYILSHNAEMAVTYLGKFSQLMRLILTNSGNKFIPLKEELTSLRHYLDLEKLRFDNKFEYEINVDNNIDDEFIEIPPMIVQPYVENAIIHGILYKTEKGLISINFEPGEKFIRCVISDNGIGREKSREMMEQAGIQRKSSGMYITKARLEMLNQELNEQFVVKVTDLKDEKGNPTGTKVELNIQFDED